MRQTGLNKKRGQFMDMNNWIKNSNILLKELANIDFGYPLDDNTIRLPRKKNIVDIALSDVGALDDALLDFYISCNGLSWADVYNGYFINAIEDLHGKRQTNDLMPSEVKGKLKGRIIVFGSDGGGALFAIRKSEKDILYLPAGRVENGIYDDTAGNVRIIGGTFSEFLEKLLRDLRAFVLDEEGHIYILQ